MKSVRIVTVLALALWGLPFPAAADAAFKNYKAVASESEGDLFLSIDVGTAHETFRATGIDPNITRDLRNSKGQPLYIHAKLKRGQLIVDKLLPSTSEVETKLPGK
jgi:hypothetical protein